MSNEHIFEKCTRQHAANHEGYSDTSKGLAKWLTVDQSAAYLAPFLKEGGLQILDVGCGSGFLTLDLASKVPHGHVTGVDCVDSLITEAKIHASQRQSSNIRFVVGNALKLPFEDDSFDVAHAHQLLHHVKDPIQVLREMRRVTKRGGIVAVREMDVAGYIWYPQVPELDLWLSRFMEAIRAHGGEPNAGRKLKAWALKAGFDQKDVTGTASIWCFTSPEDKSAWAASWARGSRALETAKTQSDPVESIGGAWSCWVNHDDAWFAVPHGEIVCRVL